MFRSLAPRARPTLSPGARRYWERATIGGLLLLAGCRQPPAVVDLTITPTAPTRADVVTAWFVVAAPRTSDLEALVRWRVDGREVLVGPSTLDLAPFAVGSVVEVTVRPYDAAAAGESATASVTIADRPPSPAVAALSPRAPQAGVPLVCALAEPAVDADGQAVSYRFDWTVGGVATEVTGETFHPGDTVPAGRIADGESWSCTVVASDGTLDTPSAPVGTRVGLHALVIFDTAEASTPAVVRALEDDGWVVDAPVGFPDYTGSDPSPAAYDVVLILDGTTVFDTMPADGADTLVRYVQAGGGVVGTEFLSFQATRTSPDLRDLALFDYVTDRTDTFLTYLVEDPTSPVMAGLPSLFAVTTECVHTVGLAHRFATDPSHVVAVDTQGSDAVVTRAFGAGRVVGLHLAGNEGEDCLDEPFVSTLFRNAALWAARADGVPGAMGVSRAGR